MDDSHDGTYAREPQVEDLARICDSLNAAGARYLLIGGFAVILHGFARTTKDIDLLVDPSADNIQAVKRALGTLADNAVAEMDDADVQRYVVVRVADEFVVDLMAYVAPSRGRIRLISSYARKVHRPAARGDADRPRTFR